MALQLISLLMMKKSQSFSLGTYIVMFPEETHLCILDLQDIILHHVYIYFVKVNDIPEFEERLRPDFFL